METAVRKKTVYFEVLRVCAVLAVIFIHTGDGGYSLFTQRQFGSTLYFADLALSIFSRFCVPMFFAISGALLLHRDEPLRDVWKRVLRIVVVLFVISLLYWFEYLSQNHGAFSFRAFFHKTYYDQARYHLWYLYSYIAFLITLPVLRPLAKNLEDRTFLYMIALEILFDGIIPILDFRINVGEFPLNPNAIPSWMFEQIFFCPLIGYYLHRRLKYEHAKKALLPLWAANLLGLAACCYMTWFKSRIFGVRGDEAPADFHFCFAALNCITLFLTARVLLERAPLPSKAESFLTGLGGTVFGVYLFHMYFLRRPWIEAIWFGLTRMGVSPMLAVTVEVLAIFAVSCIPAFILKQIPGIRKFL